MDSSSPSSAPRPSSARPVFLSIAFVLAALLISGSIVASAVIKDRGAERDAQVSRSMVLTGHASREITSDRMKWSLDISRDSNASSSIASVTDQLNKDVDTVVSMLTAAGIQHPTVSRHPASVHSATGYEGGASYAYGDQVVVIESDQVTAMNDATAAIVDKMNANGAQIISDTTEFYYSQEDSLRHELLQEALNDAKEQAKKIGGNQLGALVQVTGSGYLSLSPVNSPNNSYYGGSEDTTSIQKKATLDVTVSYAIKP